MKYLQLVLENSEAQNIFLIQIINEYVNISILHFLLCLVFKWANVQSYCTITTYKKYIFIDFFEQLLKKIVPLWNDGKIIQ